MRDDLVGAAFGSLFALGPVVLANAWLSVRRTPVTPDPGGILPPPPPTTYAKQAVDAIVAAYYPRRVSAVDTARSRAQSAYAIASTLAGTLIGAGLLTTLEDRPAVVKVVGILALLGWLGAAGCYLRAVASPIEVAKRGAQQGATKFVDNVLAQANAERKEVDARLTLANRVSFVALALTALTVALALFVTSEPTERGTVVLTDAGAAALADICPAGPSSLEGEIRSDSIGSDTLHIEADEGACDEIEVDLDIARNAVAAVRT